MTSAETKTKTETPETPAKPAATRKKTAELAGVCMLAGILGGGLAIGAYSIFDSRDTRTEFGVEYIPPEALHGLLPDGSPAHSVGSFAAWCDYRNNEHTLHIDEYTGLYSDLSRTTGAVRILIDNFQGCTGPIAPTLQAIQPVMREISK